MAKELPYDAEEAQSHRSTPRVTDTDYVREHLATWFNARMPKVSDVHISELDMPESSGMSNISLSFTLFWREQGQAKQTQYVLRMSPGAAKTVFPSYRLDHQYKIMDILGKHTDIPVAKMLAEEPDANVIGAPFFIMEYLDGLVPTDIPPYHMGGWMHDDTSAAERTQIWWLGIETMAHFHQLDYKSLGFQFLDNPELGTTPLLQQLHYWDKFLEWSVPDHPLAATALKWLREHQPKDEPTGLCWGDARLGNIMYNHQKDKIVALFDWEMARLGNPVQDLAWWNFLDDSFCHGLGVEPVSGMPDKSETIERWQKLTGFNVEDYHYYYVLGCLKHTLIMARIAYITDNQAGIVDNFVSRMLDKAGGFNMLPPLEEGEVRLLGTE